MAPIANDQLEKLEKEEEKIERREVRREERAVRKKERGPIIGPILLVLMAATFFAIMMYKTQPEKFDEVTTYIDQNIIDIKDDISNETIEECNDENCEQQTPTQDASKT